MSDGLSTRNLLIIRDPNSFRSADNNHPINFGMYICHALNHLLFQERERQREDFVVNDFLQTAEVFLINLHDNIPSNDNVDTIETTICDDFIHSIVVNEIERVIIIIDASNGAWPLILDVRAGFQFRRALVRVHEQLEDLTNSFNGLMETNNRRLAPREVRNVLDTSFTEILNTN